MSIPNKDRHAYETLRGEKLSIGWLTEPEIKYLEDLKEAVDSGDDYFDLLKRVRDVNAMPLAEFGGKVTPEAVQTIFFQVAADIVERAGVQQGRSLAPGDNRLDPESKILSMSEAAKLIGKSRQAVHLALTRGKILGWRVGSAWIVDVKSALRYANLHP